MLFLTYDLLVLVLAMDAELDHSSSPEWTLPLLLSICLYSLITIRGIFFWTLEMIYVGWIVASSTT